MYVAFQTEWAYLLQYNQYIIQNCKITGTTRVQTYESTRVDEYESTRVQGHECTVETTENVASSKYCVFGL